MRQESVFSVGWFYPNTVKPLAFVGAWKRFVWRKGGGTLSVVEAVLKQSLGTIEIKVSKALIGLFYFCIVYRFFQTYSITFPLPFLFLIVINQI